MANEIWKRVEGDTNKSYQAFCIYRNLGKDRTLEEVTKKFYYNIQDTKKQHNPLPGFASKFRQVGKWSSENKWVDRAAAYDEYLDEQARTEIIEERREAIEVQKKIARTALKKALNHIEHMNELDTSTRDMTNLMKEAANLQRLCFGDATENIKSENKNEDIVIMIPDNSRD